MALKHNGQQGQTQLEKNKQMKTTLQLRRKERENGHSRTHFLFTLLCSKLLYYIFSKHTQPRKANLQHINRYFKEENNQCKWHAHKKSPNNLTDLGGNIVRCSILQQHLSHLIMALFGSDVKRGVLVLGGGVSTGSMLQQQHHVVNIAQTWCNVQGCLLFLFQRNFDYIMDFKFLLHMDILQMQLFGNM